MYQLFRRQDIPYMVGASILGSVSHFLYDFSEHNPFTALITPVNESVWEHLKMLFFPLLLFTLLEYFIRHPNKPAFFASRFVGALSGMFSIIFLFYGYTFFLGRDFLVLDIAIFLFGVWFAFFIAGRCYRPLFGLDPLVPFLAWFFVTLLFFIFTCYPPELPLFLPPQE